MRARLIIFALTAFIFGGTAAFVGINLYQKSNTTSVAQISGKALVGGPFSMTDHKGRPVTEKDFAGQYMLIFFGFTNCPDVCPAKLQVITTAMEELGPKSEKITPVFVSVDPKRDTVQNLADYVSHFHKRLVGLTGTEEQVKKITKAYRVYFAEVKDESSSDGYTVDHSAVTYLMGPDGSYIQHFSYGTSPEKMADGISKHL